MLKNVAKSVFPKTYIHLQSGRWRKRYEQWLDELRQDDRLPELHEMLFTHYETNSPLNSVSNQWLHHCMEGVELLHQNGLSDIKQTVARRYFTSLFSADSPVVRRLLGELESPKGVDATVLLKKHSQFSQDESLKYNLLTYLVWNFASKRYPELLSRAEEPMIGDPPGIQLNGRYVTYDLISSILEWNQVFNTGRPTEKIETVMELGAGFGRTAAAILQAEKGIRQYSIVDIPPALFVSQTYLSKVFPEKKIFKFRPFNSYEEVRTEYENSEIAFLLPHQLEMLPEKYIDLFLAIDCMHEMTPGQIENYFSQINRLARYFFLKCKKETNIDGISLKESDYPVPARWKSQWRRDGEVLDHYFETMYRLD